MRFAYADPPYPGCAHIYLRENPSATEVDHAALLQRLVAEYPDGWALSTSSAALRDVLALCPPGVRVAAWCKPFAPWRIGKNDEGKAAFAPYTWEPVIFTTQSKRSREARLGVWCRDYLLESPPLKQRIPGEKPTRFGWWIFSLLGAGAGDEMHDLFPGSGAIGDAWSAWCGDPLMTEPLFATTPRSSDREGTP